MPHVDETILNSLLASGVDLPTALAAATIPEPAVREHPREDESPPGIQMITLAGTILVGGAILFLFCYLLQ